MVTFCYAIIYIHLLKFLRFSQMYSFNNKKSKMVAVVCSSRKEESCGVKLCTFFFFLVLSFFMTKLWKLKKKIILTNTTYNL